MDRWTLHRGDCRDVLKIIGDACIDSVVTDPPYELGFMGKRWDATGIAYAVDLWREVLRVLKPGAHLLAFGGPRTYHRMACAIEDAGFQIRDSLHWIYGSGFPKSLNIGDGRGTALKPAHEPIVLARKPLDGTVAINVQTHGTGALNIDACRIGNETTGWGGGGNRVFAVSGSGIEQEQYAVNGDARPVSGRWPANVLFDEDAAAELDAQSGVRASGSGNKNIRNRDDRNAYGTGLGKGNGDGTGGDTGGASRFFYVAKPSRAERDQGCDHLPARTAGEATDRKDGTDGLNSPRAGAGRTGGAKNYHPTVKPIELMQWLVRLITPPDGVVLDPFAGSGTTGIAALRQGARFIGIDLDPGYARIALTRIEEDAPLFNRKRAP